MTKALPPSGEELVHIALMANIKNDSVPIGIEYPVKRHRKLHRTEIGGQMSAGFCDAVY